MTAVHPDVEPGLEDQGDDWELAELVLRKLRRLHAGCAVRECPQHRLWTEDVREIIALVRDLS